MTDKTCFFLSTSFVFGVFLYTILPPPGIAFSLQVGKMYLCILITMSFDLDKPCIISLHLVYASIYLFLYTYLDIQLHATQATFFCIVNGSRENVLVVLQNVLNTGILLKKFTSTVLIYSGPIYLFIKSV